MKKALLIVVAILAVTFFLGNAELVNQFLETIGSGTTIPLLAAVVFMVIRHFTQAASYDAAFGAVGKRTGFWHNVNLIFSLVFINTFCMFSGATGLAFIIDDLHRKGADLGTATAGGLLSQIGFFAAVFFISIISTVVMLISNSLNTIILIGFVALAAVLFGQTAFFVIGYFKPDWLYALLGFAEKVINRVLGLFKKSLRAAWATSTADQFIKSSRILAHNPSGVAITIAWATLSGVCNMSCLVAIGFAFGCESTEALVASFGITVVSIMLSPTPQGIGVTEAAITAVLTAAGETVTTAAAIALVYRGIMLWIPFVVGAIMLSQSGFFKGKKSTSAEQKNKDVGWITGTLMGIVGLVNIVLALAAPALAPYGLLTQFVDLTGLLVGQTVIVGGVLLLICAVGLIMRLRIAWAVSMAVLFILGGLELYFETYQVALAVIALAVVLLVKHDAFDQPAPWNRHRDKRLPGGPNEGGSPEAEGGPSRASDIDDLSATLDDLSARSRRTDRQNKERDAAPSDRTADSGDRPALESSDAELTAGAVAAATAANAAVSKTREALK